MARSGSLPAVEVDALDRAKAGSSSRAIGPTGRLSSMGSRFLPGDRLREWFSPRFPFNAFAVCSPTGQLRGWYANVTYPGSPRRRNDPADAGLARSLSRSGWVCRTVVRPCATRTSSLRLRAGGARPATCTAHRARRRPSSSGASGAAAAVRPRTGRNGRPWTWKIGVKPRQVASCIQNRDSFRTPPLTRPSTGGTLIVGRRKDVSRGPADIAAQGSG